MGWGLGKVRKRAYTAEFFRDYMEHARSVGMECATEQVPNAVIIKPDWPVFSRIDDLGTDPRTRRVVYPRFLVAGLVSKCAAVVVWHDYYKEYTSSYDRLRWGYVDMDIPDADLLQRTYYVLREPRRLPVKAIRMAEGNVPVLVLSDDSEIDMMSVPKGDDGPWVADLNALALHTVKVVRKLQVDWATEKMRQEDEEKRRRAEKAEAECHAVYMAYEMCKEES